MADDGIEQTSGCQPSDSSECLERASSSACERKAAHVLDANWWAVRAPAATHLEQIDGELGELRAAAQECRKSRIYQAEEEAQLHFVEGALVRMEELRPNDFSELLHA
jgi:hypothetical protein